MNKVLLLSRFSLACFNTVTNIDQFPGFEECIDQMEGFDYIWVLTFMHLNSGFKKKIKPQPRPGADGELPTQEVGLFCSRAPHRPNRIALSALQVKNYHNLTRMN